MLASERGAPSCSSLGGVTEIIGPAAVSLDARPSDMGCVKRLRFF